MKRNIVAAALLTIAATPLAAQHAQTDSTHREKTHQTQSHAPSASATLGLHSAAFREGYGISPQTSAVAESRARIPFAQGAIQFVGTAYATLHEREFTANTLIAAYERPIGPIEASLEYSRNQLHHHVLHEVALGAKKPFGPLTPMLRVVTDLETRRGVFTEGSIESTVERLGGLKTTIAVGTYNHPFPEHGGITHSSAEFELPIRREKHYDLFVHARGQAARGPHSYSGVSLGIAARAR